jgi:hypothetical protein
MYAMLASIMSAFLWSVILKITVFDKMVKERLQEGTKLRDLKREDAILQKSKFFQLITCSVAMLMMVKMDLNLFSVTRLKEDLQAFNLKSGKTFVVDNRFNCTDCAYPVQEGDIILFGKGTIGKILALPGDVIAQTREGSLGRSIASETIMNVPEGYVAIKTSKGKEVVFVKISDLIGKLKKP